MGKMVRHPTVNSRLSLWGSHFREWSNDLSRLPLHSESGAGRNNVIVTLLVFGLIVALFFIPEIVSMRGSSDERQPKAEQVPESKPAATQSPEQAPYLIDETAIHAGPLEQILNQTEARGSLRQQDPLRAEGSFEEYDGDRDFVIPSGQGASWDDLQKGQLRRELNSAARTIRTLLNDIPLGFAETRQSLFVYSSALQQVLRSGRRFLSAAEVVPILDQLDQNVTNAMLREGVERGVFIRWQEVSLGPILKSSVAYRLKQQILTPYRPNFGIESVRIFQAPTNHGVRNLEASMRMRLRVYVQGSDTSTIELYRNGQLFFSRPVRKRGDRMGRRRFTAPPDPDIRGVIYTLRVIDINGATAEKHYRFDGNIERFRWTRTYGVFSIPFPHFDPRIDRVFLVASSFGDDSAALTGGATLGRF